MAFPASPSNNQVHKEGNRSFVYDSTLGVWDQVKEIDRSSLPTSRGSSVPISSLKVTTDQIILTPGVPPAETEGAMYYDSTSDKVVVWNGTAWEQVSNAIGFEPKASGGIITQYSANSSTYAVHTFNTSGVFTPTSSFSVEYIVVAGGGGGGNYGGGAGGGGYRSSVIGEISGGGAAVESTLSLTADVPYTITVGAGGQGTHAGAGGFGGNSSITGTGITNIISLGGGAGGHQTAGIGGSGGGGNANAPGYAGTAGQGYAGGNGTIFGGSDYYNGGGGGGAGSAGITSSVNTPNNGHGGKGVQSWISGSSVYYAGGGGGGGWNRAPASMAYSGRTTQLDTHDDSGSPRLATAYGSKIENAPANRGGGGAGQAVTGGCGAGGSGVVIIRYTI